MNRNELVKRLESLRQQKAQSEAVFEQIKANINAIHGAIQFAEDLLKDMPEMVCTCGDDPLKGCSVCPTVPVLVVPQADGDASMESPADDVNGE